MTAGALTPAQQSQRYRAAIELAASVDEYSAWREEGLLRPLEFDSSSVEALREEGRYEIITPDECIARHRASPDFFATIHPLIGGVPLERGWQCLRLYAERVLPALER
jgi:hypothetical protein